MAKTLTLLIMDPPYESANTATEFRLIQSALEQGHNVNVFAYEGAVSLTIKNQQPHANPVHGTTCEKENHPTTREWVASLFKVAQKNGVTLTWTNCGLCVDERGAGDWIDGVKRGGPKDFLDAALVSDATLVIPTK